MSCLNKICPENLSVIAKQMAEIQIESPSELALLISVLFRKALADPHYCETYADAVFELSSKYSEFPPVDGRSPVTFKRILVSACQREFEDIVCNLESQEIAAK